MEALNWKIYPRSSFMKGIVDHYQWVQITEPVMLKTLPNGRLDAWINFVGSFYFLDEQSSGFVQAPPNGFFPLSDKSMLVSIPEKIVCLNIKFFPHALLYGNINNLLSYKQPVSFHRIFDTDIKASIYDLAPEKENIDAIIEITEEYFTLQLSGADKEKTWLHHILQRIEKDETNPVSIKWLAKEFHLTEKTLERTFAKQVGLTPKLFSKIVQFHKAVKAIKNTRNTASKLQLNQSLSNGYHDQSHFGKDSKKIAGLTPKLLFRKLLPGFHDLIISETAPR